ncbi:glycosyltransferase [Paenibacillus lutrae]|uniref:Glycosyltransferase n=1 Tax=Paenibacillus lutrae TaxID=2078573 RepID=A0A7X3FE69_9BACL|nr:glycosyltransferase [Paenibacillus lutrae]
MESYQVIWNGAVRNSSGINTASREYALALHRQGVDVKIKSRRHGKGQYRKTTDQLDQLIHKGYAQGKQRVLIHHGHPNTLNIQEARQNSDVLLLNTVWETTKIPRSWFPNINRFDAVCVPSYQNRKALRDSGVKVPVYLVPHGVHTNKFTPANPKLSLPLLPQTFVFVSVFTFQHRKNPETLLRAYWEEFSSADHVALLIKTSGSNIQGQIRAYKKKLGITKKTSPLYIMNGRADPRKLKGIYTKGNAFVLPTRGEGVGLPFLESLASGTPVIATGWGGHMDFVDSGNSFLVDYDLRPTTASMKQSISKKFEFLFAQQGQQWAEADLASLRKQMRLAYENPELCRRKGMQGRKDMFQWSWNRSGRRMKQVIESVLRSKT